MIRYPVLLSLLGLALLAAACGGGSTETPSPTDGATPTIQPTETPGALVSPTAATDETPSNEETPTTEGTSQSPTASPTLAGTPALNITDLDIAITSEQADCIYDSETSIADCADQGTYTIDPPLTGPYTACTLRIIQDQPVLLECAGEGNLPTVYYIIP